MPTPHRISFRPLLMILAALALLFCGEDAAGTIKIAIGNDTLRKPVKSTGGWDEWLSQPVGRVTLDSNQMHTLRVQVDSMVSNRFVNLDHVEIIPENTP